MSASSETKGISVNMDMEQVTFIHAFNGFFFFDNGLSCLSWNKINKKVLQTLHKIIHPVRGSEDHLSRYGEEFLRSFFVCAIIKNKIKHVALLLSYTNEDIIIIEQEK